jgi:hypothetical protein
VRIYGVPGTWSLVLAGKNNIFFVVVVEGKSSATSASPGLRKPQRSISYFAKLSTLCPLHMIATYVWDIQDQLTVSINRLFSNCFGESSHNFYLIPSLISPSAG